VTTKELPRNRVDIDINISEGSAARIRKINVVGNQVFTDKEILKRLESGIPSWYMFLSSKDKYSKQKLAGDLEKIRTLYLDNGYINFNILSTQVTITPDRKDLFVTINIEEGEQYTVSDVSLEGEFIIDKSELEQEIKITAGDVFSAAKITDTTTALGNRLGNYGYAFANINSIPDVDEVNRTVKLTFFVDPGRRVYVRRINFSGNYMTSGEVLRREMRQMEAGWYSSSKVDRSKIRIQRLPYITSVNVNTKRVAGIDDQVDLDVVVEERLAGSFTVGAGFSQTEGLTLNLGVTQENFKGTGKTVSVNASGSRSTQNINFSYLNPYWTIDGVSRGFSAYYQSTDTTDLNISTFIADRKGLSMNFGVPLTEFDSFRSGLALENTDITTSEDTAVEITDFVEQYGNSNTVLRWTSSYIHDTRNRTVFAEKGNYQIISFAPTVPGSDLTYWKLTYNGKFYTPFIGDSVLNFRTNLGVTDAYGKEENAVVPFYDKFYAGGFSTVRGFEQNTLSPKGSTGTAIGGDLKTVFNLEWIFPMPFVEDTGNMRLSAFYDVGNVYATPEDFEAKELRTAAGIAFVWLSPVGPLTLSYAKPIDYQDGDSLQEFQFNVGAGF
jgi:outer membrane protein insertion porin family